MSDMRYFGAYLRFTCKDKKNIGLMLGADTLVGNTVSLSFRQEEESPDPVCWVKNKFDADLGTFSSRDTYRLNVMQANGWNLYAALATVGFTENADDGFYWGDVAVVACPPAYSSETEVFFNGVCEKLASGVRPDLELVSSSVDTMLAAKGNWLPQKQLPLEKKKGEAVVKSKMSASEKAIEQGRKGNIGCYVISWLFIIALVAGAGYLAAKMFGLL